MGLCPEITNKVGLVRLLKGTLIFSLLQEQDQVSEAAGGRMEVVLKQKLRVFSRGDIGSSFTKSPFQV